MSERKTRRRGTQIYRAGKALQEHCKALEAALEWALSDIEGRAKYYNPFQRGECIKRSKALLSKEE